MSGICRSRKGMSLMELIVALGILSVAVAIGAPLAMRSTRPATEVDAFAQLRHQAIAGKSPVRRHIRWRDTTVQATAFPDGTLLVDSIVPMDRYTGKVRHATR